MLTIENVNFCDQNEYSSSGAVGTTLTYHADSDIVNSGAIGITDIWYYTDTDGIPKGTITCNIEGVSTATKVAIYKSDGSNTSLLFDSDYQDIEATSFIVNNLAPEDHKMSDLYFEISYQGIIKSKFSIQQTFESGIYKFSFSSIKRSYAQLASKAYITIRDISVERIRNFDNLYSTIANSTNITTTVSTSNIGLGYFNNTLSTQQRITERRLTVDLMDGNTTVQQLLSKTFEVDENNYESISFVTPGEIISSHHLRIIITKTYTDSPLPAIIDIPIHDGTNALLCPDCTYYICFNHSNQRTGATTTLSEEETIDSLSLSRYPFTKSIWQSIIEPIVIKGDSQYIPAYNDIIIGSTGSTSGDSTQACIFKENIAGVTGNIGCDIYIFQRSTGITIPMQTYIKVKPVATQTYVVGQAIRACDLLNEVDMYDPSIIH